MEAVLKKKDPKILVEIGGYVGYSALVFAHYSNAVVHSIEINSDYAEVARAIHKHAGLAERIHIHVGTVETKK